MARALTIPPYRLLGQSYAFLACGPPVMEEVLVRARPLLSSGICIFAVLWLAITALLSSREDGGKVDFVCCSSSCFLLLPPSVVVTIRRGASLKTKIWHCRTKRLSDLVRLLLDTPHPV